MSGKPKTKESPNWGGRRPGAGQPKKSLSVGQLKEIKRLTKARAKKEGRQWLDVLYDFIYGHEWRDGEKVDLELEPRDRISALRLLADVALVKQSEQNVNVSRAEGPQIYLPEMRPDPAKLIVLPEKKAEACGS